MFFLKKGKRHKEMKDFNIVQVFLQFFKHFLILHKKLYNLDPHATALCAIGADVNFLSSF